MTRSPLFLLAALPVLAAGQGRMPLQHAPAQTVLTDDDDGKVEIIPPHPAPDAIRTFHGGAILAAPQVTTLFVGAAWSKPSNCPLMGRLGDALVAYGVSERFSALQGLGLKAFSFPVVSGGVLPTAEERKVLPDLGAQHLLHHALGLGRLAAPAPDDVVVLYLAPGLSSSLNGQPSGTAFQAYHSTYHDEAGAVRYVVVPMGSSEGATVKAAEQALTAAILDPDGDGWY